MCGRSLMAAALIDRLVHHCHMVTIRGNSYRMREHTELWQTLRAPHDDAPAPPSGRRDDLRLVPSSTCQIFNRICQIFDRR